MFSWTELDLFNPTPEHAMLRASVRAFVEREVEPQAAEHDRAERFNLPLFRKLGPLGLLGLTVPEQDGGSGMDAVAAVIVHEELGSSDPGFCLAYLAHSVLFVHNFCVNASQELRHGILPRVMAGEWVGGMCMSEAGAGTDVLAMQTRAERARDDYVINGRKMWITNGCLDAHSLGDVFLVYARTGGNSGDASGISTFVVENGRPGLRLGQRILDKAGMRASATAELIFDDCRVPATNLVGTEGESLIQMMRNLELERIALAAISLGIARRCLDIMVGHAGQRRSFGRVLAEHGQVQKYLAEGYAHYMAARTFVYDVARRSCGVRAGSRLDSDAAKLVAAPMAKQVADHAIQVLGACGYMGDYVVQRLWRDSKLLEIGGGTLEAHQKNMARDLTRMLRGLGSR